MKCPHCSKEVFGRGHDVSDLYEEPKELTREEQLQTENERLRQTIKKAHWANNKSIQQCAATMKKETMAWMEAAANEETEAETMTMWLLEQALTKGE